MGNATLIMVYFTDGFFEWGKFFLRTLKHTNGFAYDVVMCTVGLNDIQIAELEALYGPMSVLNQPYDIDSLSKRSGIPRAELMLQKEAIEKKYVTHNTRCWKLLHAGDQRIDFVQAAYTSAVMNGYSRIMCFDVDTYFRKTLNELDQLAYNYDAMMKFRLNNPTLKARITIDLMIFGCDDPSLVMEFLDDWKAQVDAVPPAKRPVGFGQYSCLLSYYKYQTNLTWGCVPVEYGLPGRLKEDDYIWTGNIHKKTKVEVLEMFEADFAERCSI